MFKFCPKCKAELQQEKDHYWCEQCGFDFFNGPNPGAGVFLLNGKGQIYLAKRVKNPGAGFWEISGGFVNAHESAEDAARREVKEELGLELNELEFLGSISNDYLYKGTQYYPLDIFFKAKVDLEELEPIEKEEFSEGKFFDPKEIELESLAFESQRKALKQFFNLNSL